MQSYLYFHLFIYFDVVVGELVSTLLYKPMLIFVKNMIIRPKL